MSDYISKTDVDQYGLLSPLLRATYNEIQELSKKKPETPLNIYKVQMINRILVPLKEMLKNEPTNAYLDILDPDNLPTYSDVVLILSQFQKAIDMFKLKYFENSVKGRGVWAIKE